MSKTKKMLSEICVSKEGSTNKAYITLSAGKKSRITICITQGVRQAGSFVLNFLVFLHPLFIYEYALVAVRVLLLKTCCNDRARRMQKLFEIELS